MIVETTDSTLNIYDLAERPQPSRTVALPHAPSHLEKYLWSSDGGYFYFGLHTEPFIGEPTSSSLGLWRLDAKTGELVEVVPAVPGSALLVTTSQNGEWLLVRHSGVATATRVHIPTETLEEYTLPGSAIPTMEDYVFTFPALLSDSGQWLFFKPYQSEAATFVHLPSGESVPFDLPAEARIVGWR